MRRILRVAAYFFVFTVAVGAAGSSWGEGNATSAPLTLIGRGGSDVVLVERDGAVQKIDKSTLTLPNQPGAGLLEYNRRVAEQAEKAREAKTEKVEGKEPAKGEEAKAEQTETPGKGQSPKVAPRGAAPETAKAAAEKAAQEQRIAEAKQKRQEKILRKYIDKDYAYGPGSVPEAPDSENKAPGASPSSTESPPPTESVPGNP